jgi:succinate dehydrogenase cytochrome b556 subunit
MDRGPVPPPLADEAPAPGVADSPGHGGAPPRADASASPSGRASPESPAPTLAWIGQAVSGILLVVLVSIHIIANHFVAPRGLRTFADVVAYLSNPLIVAIEVTFLVTVSYHGLLGVRAVLLDFGLRPTAERRLTRFLTAVGIITVAYGLWLTWVITSYR